MSVFFFLFWFISHSNRDELNIFNCNIKCSHLYHNYIAYYRQTSYKIHMNIYQKLNSTLSFNLHLPENLWYLLVLVHFSFSFFKKKKIFLHIGKVHSFSRRKKEFFYIKKKRFRCTVPLLVLSVTVVVVEYFDPCVSFLLSNHCFCCSFGEFKRIYEFSNEVISSFVAYYFVYVFRSLSLSLTSVFMNLICSQHNGKAYDINAI